MKKVAFESLEAVYIYIYIYTDSLLIKRNIIEIKKDSNKT